MESPRGMPWTASRGVPTFIGHADELWTGKYLIEIDDDGGPFPREMTHSTVEGMRYDSSAPEDRA